MVENVIHIKSDIMINVGVNAKKHHVCEKEYIWNPATCSCKNGRYLASIIDNSVITCDDVIDAEKEMKTVTTNFNKKDIICERRSFYIRLAFLLITIDLLIAVGIYCYLIKHKARQKYLLPCYVSKNKLKKFCIKNIL